MLYYILKIMKIFIKTSILDKALFEFIERYNPNYFLTVQFPEHKKTENSEISNNRLRIIMKNFERQLLGRYWNKHHLPFICFAELGTSKMYHYHILFNSKDFKSEDIQSALNKTTYQQKLPSYSLKLEQIVYNEEIVFVYCTKEIKIKNNNKFDSSKIITSHDLFDISVK